MDAPSARLRVRVTPGARRSEIVGRHGDAWRIRVTAAPERGRANDEVLDLLAATLGLPRARVKLVAGTSFRDKLVELEGIETGEAEERLERTRRAR